MPIPTMRYQLVQHYTSIAYVLRVQLCPYRNIPTFSIQPSPLIRVAEAWVSYALIHPAQCRHQIHKGRVHDQCHFDSRQYGVQDQRQ